MKKYKYLLCLFVPFSIMTSLMSKSFWVYKPLFFFFVLVPLVELFSKPDLANPADHEERQILSCRYYDWLLYSFVPLQYLTLGYFLFTIGSEVENYLVIGKVISMGLACGIMGINVAHELGHRATWYERWMSKALLLTSLYMHFFIEHNFGHHKNVATDLDPASAREGESIYAFFLRSITSGWISAWKIQKDMLKQKSKPFLCFENQMLSFVLIQLTFIGLIYVVFGAKTMLYFLFSALIGILLLETVNYIEHYGLRRKVKANGTYDRTLPIHSWNSNHPIGRILLFELSRHSDHHYMASRKYPILRHFDHSLQMPTGYPGMMILSLIPPLWFHTIHKILKNYKKWDFASELG